jgi:hypothetical protein
MPRDAAILRPRISADIATSLPILNPQPQCACQRKATERKQHPETDFPKADIEFFPQVFDIE